MDRPIELLKSLAHNSDSSTISNYLNFSSDSQLFVISKDNREATVNFVNQLLNSKVHYAIGLSVLDVLLDQLTKDFVSSNILCWIQQTIKYLVNQEDGSVNPLAWKVLGKLLHLSVDYPEPRKNLALNFLPKILDHFVKESKNSRESISTILQCLDQTLKAYGKSCGYHKEVLAEVIFSFLEAPEKTVFIAGLCFLDLAACGSPGANSENYVTSWMKQQKFLINCLHQQLNILFENTHGIQENIRIYHLEEKYPTIPKVLEKGLIKKKHRLTKQFQSLSTFFKIMLLGKFPVRKRILPEAVLSLVWRGLAINRHTLAKKHSIDEVNLATVISTINLAALEILDALIVSCKLNLLPFSATICRILFQTFKCTEVSDWPFGINKPQCSLRGKLYDCLNNWLTASRACSGIEKHIDDILTSIILDICYEPPKVALKVSGGKGKKTKSMQPEHINPSAEFIINPMMNSDTCEAALKCLSVLLSTSSTVLKPDHHRNLQEAIVSKLICSQHSTVPLPYSSIKCRLALYDALLSICENPHRSFPPPINYACELFSAGVKDPSIEVSRFCLMALRSIDKILRPVCPSLDLPSSENALPAIDISAYDVQDVGYLLNDESARKRKMKRKLDHQLTSTPLSNSHSKRSFIEDIDQLSFKESPRIPDHKIIAPEIQKTSGEEVIDSIIDGSKLDILDQEMDTREPNGSNNVNAIKEYNSSSPSEIHQVNETSSNNVAEKFHEPLQSTSDPDSAPSIESDGTVECTKQGTCEKADDIASNGSDSEMMNSFVDEVN